MPFYAPLNNGSLTRPMFFYVCNGRWPGATHSANPDGRKVEEKESKTPLSRFPFADFYKEDSEARTSKPCKRGSKN